MGAGVAVVQDPTLEAEAERMGIQAAATAVPIQPGTAGQGPRVERLGFTSLQAKAVGERGVILPARPRASVALPPKPSPILPPKPGSPGTNTSRVPILPSCDQRKFAARTAGLLQLKPGDFFPALRGVPTVGLFEFGSRWQPIRDRIEAYSRLSEQDLQARDLALQNIRGSIRAWKDYCEQNPGQAPERIDFVNTLVMAVAEEENEIGTLRRNFAEYAVKLGNGGLFLGDDLSAFLRGKLANPVGSLAGLTIADIPALNALNTYTAAGYRLQNPLLRGGRTAFDTALAEKRELDTVRAAIDDPDVQVKARRLADLVKETRVTSELVDSILYKKAPFVGLVYRGTGRDDLSEFGVGTISTDAAFASASTDREFALQYVDHDKRYQILQQIQSKTGRAIKDAVPGGEMANEVLFKRNTSFRVTKGPVEKVLNGVRCLVVEMTEV
jgi:hypothetical protein